jgi:hypothetical protein
VELEYKTFRVAGFEVTEMGGVWGLSMTCSAVSHGWRLSLCKIIWQTIPIKRSLHQGPVVPEPASMWRRCGYDLTACLTAYQQRVVSSGLYKWIEKMISVSLEAGQTFSLNWNIFTIKFSSVNFTFPEHSVRFLGALHFHFSNSLNVHIPVVVFTKLLGNWGPKTPKSSCKQGMTPSLTFPSLCLISINCVKYWNPSLCLISINCVKYCKQLFSLYNPVRWKKKTLTLGRWRLVWRLQEDRR